MTLVCLVLLWAGSVASSADPGSTESAKRGSRDAKAEAVINVRRRKAERRLPGLFVRLSRGGPLVIGY
jgi:hypothetical protein